MLVRARDVPDPDTRALDGRCTVAVVGVLDDPGNTLQYAGLAIAGCDVLVAPLSALCDSFSAAEEAGAGPLPIGLFLFFGSTHTR